MRFVDQSIWTAQVWLTVIISQFEKSHAGVASYTEQYLQYAQGSSYTSTFDNYSEQECADACTFELTCASFEWRDPTAATGSTGNCRTNSLGELDGPGLTDSDSELWNFYEADAVTCPDYPTIVGSSLSSSGSAKGDTAEIICDDGYLGGGKSYCQGNGQWDQRYNCYGTSSLSSITATDCTWRAESSEGAGTFELGNIGSTPTFWLEEEFYQAYCWTGSVSTIATSTTTMDTCKTLCDADSTCTGATFDGTDCTYFSGIGELTPCADTNYGYQKLTKDVDAIGSSTFAHCGDQSLLYDAQNVVTSNVWLFVGCYDQADYFQENDFTSITADTPTNAFATAEAANNQYVAFAYVGGDSGHADSLLYYFTDLYASASDSTSCQVACLDDSSYYCGDELLINDEGNGGFAVYLFQPNGAAISVVNDDVTNPSTFDLVSGQSYIVHYWAFVQQVNSTAYSAHGIEIDTRVSDATNAVNDADLNTVTSAFEWFPFWHDIFVASSDVTASLTIGSRQASTRTAIFIDDVVVYCVSCCYPFPDFFLPDRMYYEEATGTLAVLDAQSPFWNADVSSDYTTAMVDTYVTEVCAAITSADSTTTARLGLALSYKTTEHPVVGGNFVMEFGPEGVASAYNYDAAPTCGCYALDSGINAIGGYYQTHHTFINAPSGTWTYGLYVKASSDFDGHASTLQAQWLSLDGTSIAVTSTGPWVTVNNLPVYGEWIYISKTVTLSDAPGSVELYLHALGENSAGSVLIYSVELLDPFGHDWLEGTGQFTCGADFPNYVTTSGDASIVSVTCEGQMIPEWTEYKLEGTATGVDVVLYGIGDTGCVSYVSANTWTQSSEYKGNSWDFYNNCNKFCTDAGSSCNGARYASTENSISCTLGPLAEVIECQCDDDLIIYSVTTNDDFDISLNIGSTDDQIVTGGTNSDGSYEVESDAECMVICRDIENCEMFEWYEPINCMLYTSDFSVVNEVCLGTYEYSEEATDWIDGTCQDTPAYAFDSSASSNDAIFALLEEKIEDEGLDSGTRSDLDDLCKGLCETEAFDCLAYAVASDTLFGTSSYRCDIFPTCDTVDSSDSDMRYSIKEYDLTFLNIGQDLQCSSSTSTSAGTVTLQECAFLCLKDSLCETFSWAEDGTCDYSNTAEQCTIESGSATAVYYMNECRFFQKGSSRETDVFHAAVTSESQFFGAVAPFDFGSGLESVVTQTDWVNCDPGSLVALSPSVTNFNQYCGGTWSSDLSDPGVTEVALCYDAAVVSAGDSTLIQIVIYGNDGSCYYSTDASSVVSDTSCSWTMTSADILSAGVGIEFAPSDSSITTLWDGTCLQEGADPGLHETCTGPAGCISGWEGILCDQDIDDCASFPCEDHLNCVDLGTNAYECQCVGGWGAQCLQPVSIQRRTQILHLQFCHVATDASCSVYAQDHTFTGDVVSFNVCKNYCTGTDWCTHMSWDISTNECRIFDSSTDNCATQVFASDIVIFEPCSDSASKRQTEGYRYLQIGSRGAPILNSFERSEFTTIDLT
jgi:hypothetical protein